MKLKKMICEFILCGGIVAGIAGPSQAAGQLYDMGEQSVDMLPVGDALMAMPKAGPSEAEVGDADSFGRSVTYLGVAQTQNVTLQADCSMFPPDDGVCVELDAAPAITTVDEADLAVIELPKKATQSLICFTITPFTTWNWSNSTGVQQLARMALRPQIRVESEVLNDPSLINPETGMPFSGVLFDQTVSNFIQIRSIEPGQSDLQFRAMTRSCIGGLVSRRSLVERFGLSDKVIKRFFKKPITLSFGVRGTVSMVDNASYTVGVRLYGD